MGILACFHHPIVGPFIRGRLALHHLNPIETMGLADLCDSIVALAAESPTENLEQLTQIFIKSDRDLSRDTRFEDEVLSQWGNTPEQKYFQKTGPNS